MYYYRILCALGNKALVRALVDAIYKLYGYEYGCRDREASGIFSFFSSDAYIDALIDIASNGNDMFFIDTAPLSDPSNSETQPLWDSVSEFIGCEIKLEEVSVDYPTLPYSVCFMRKFTVEGGLRFGLPQDIDSRVRKDIYFDYVNGIKVVTNWFIDEEIDPDTFAYFVYLNTFMPSSEEYISYVIKGLLNQVPSRMFVTKNLVNAIISASINLIPDFQEQDGDYALIELISQNIKQPILRDLLSTDYRCFALGFNEDHVFTYESSRISSMHLLLARTLFSKNAIAAPLKRCLEIFQKNSLIISDTDVANIILSPFVYHESIPSGVTKTLIGALPSNKSSYWDDAYNILNTDNKDMKWLQDKICAAFINNPVMFRHAGSFALLFLKRYASISTFHQCYDFFAPLGDIVFPARQASEAYSNWDFSVTKRVLGNLGYEGNVESPKSGSMTYDLLQLHFLDSLNVKRLKDDGVNALGEYYRPLFERLIKDSGGEIDDIVCWIALGRQGKYFASKATLKVIFSIVNKIVKGRQGITEDELALIIKSITRKEQIAFLLEVFDLTPVDIIPFLEKESHKIYCLELII